MSCYLDTSMVQLMGYTLGFRLRLCGGIPYDLFNRTVQGCFIGIGLIIWLPFFFGYTTYCVVMVRRMVMMMTTTNVLNNDDDGDKF